jgi:hypothetical protein
MVVRNKGEMVAAAGCREQGLDGVQVTFIYHLARVMLSNNPKPD